ncbi:MAG: hypothetical protein IPK96_16855 [Flammeovirgaceae bacterium]|nr:hypothetical protein [Flammeovirgaceae bacterium]
MRHFFSIVFITRCEPIVHFNEYVDETQLSFKNDGIENYLGGQIDFRFDSLGELSSSAEYLLGDTIN